MGHNKTKKLYIYHSVQLRRHTTIKMGENIKLFVYGVSASCPKGVLEKEFNRYGRVSDVFITGKGYAFITMESKEEAVDALNGKKVDGQDIKVEMAHGKGTSRGRDGGGRRDFGDRDRRGYGGGGRFGDRDRDRDRGHRGGGGRFDGGYSRNDKAGDRSYGRDRSERRSDRGGDY